NARAIELTEALLLLSRADRRSFAREQVDLSLVAEEATETLLPLAEKRGLTIESSGERTPTIGSHALLLQLTSNLGLNAIVHDLPSTIAFFRELGLELEGRAMVEGEWAGRVTGLGDQRVEIAMMRTPDGHSRLELSRFLRPPAVADHRNAPVNALG